MKRSSTDRSCIFSRKPFRLVLGSFALLLAFSLTGCGGGADQFRTLAFQSTFASSSLTQNGYDVTLGGTGIFDPFGAYSGVLTHSLTVNPDSLVVQIVNGQFAYAFANGDSLKGTYSGTITFAQADSIAGDISIQYVITGGTGDLLGATGSGTGTGNQSADGVVTIKTNGTMKVLSL